MAAGLALAAIALWLRVSDAKSRLFHADEGVQSYQAWRLMNGGDYRYDATEHHGPSLYFFSQWSEALFGGNDGEVSDFGMRLVPMAFGLAAILCGLFLWGRYDYVTGFIWAAIVSIAPLSVIYSSYFIQESILAFFSITALVGLFGYAWNLSRRWGVLFAVSAGMMHVTKETALLHLFVMVVAALGVFAASGAFRNLSSRRLLADAGLFLLIFGAIHVSFFSSFGENPKGIADAITAYFNYAERSQGQGHEKALSYYLSFFFPRTIEGVRWGELSFLLLALWGAASAFWPGIGRQQAKGSREYMAQFVVANGIGLLVLYSIIPYKNPWLMLTPYLLLAYAAAWGLVGFFRNDGSRLRLGLGSLLALWLLLDLSDATRKAVFEYPSASRNPYLYMHTTPRYGLLLEQLQVLKEEIPAEDFSVSVFSSDASWPLPWHLRNWEKVGYWKDLKASDTSVSIYDTRLLQESAFMQSHAEDYWNLYGLRPNTLLSMRVRKPYDEVLINKR